MDPPTHFPKLGETRCYWFLLDADFRFLFTDSVMTNHLKEQAELLIGRNFLELIHPDERENATRDLHLVIQHQDIHGSVTRAKYLRLSQIRVLLGAAVKETFPHAAQVGYDKDYLPCDLVLNWVADNLVLCFIHAVIVLEHDFPADISPEDNDELHKGRWTNWCGTVSFSAEQCSLLNNRLAQANLISQQPHGTPHNTNNVTGDYRQESHQGLSAALPRRVFQILANSPARRPVFTWPRQGCDVNQFGKLASNVRIDSPVQSANASPASSSGMATASFALSPRAKTVDETRQHQHQGENDQDSPYAEVRTSCTRRYNSQQSFLSNGMLHEVDSIFIPHGSVIFACHQVTNRRPSYDGLSASSAAPAFRPQSQQWTLKHDPLTLHSDNERYTVPSSSEFTTLSPSHKTAPPFSSGYTNTPTSSDNREWHDWHHYSSSGFSAGAHNRLPKSSLDALGRTPEEETVENKSSCQIGTETPSRGVNQTQDMSWFDRAHLAPAYVPNSGSWPQNAIGVGDLPSAQHQAHSPSSQSGMSSAGSTSYRPRVHTFSSIATRRGGTIPSFDDSTIQQLPAISPVKSHPMLPPPSHLVPYLPPPNALGIPGSSPHFDYCSDRAFGQHVIQGVAAAQAPHLGRPRATGVPPSSSDVPPSTAVPAAGFANTGGSGAGGRSGGRRGGNSVNGGRVSGNPPAGVTHCAFCETTTSPEWRKGVTGIKNLCNACGLRYARTRQKEEGHVPNRRRVLGAADIQASPASVGPVTQNPSVISFKKRALSDNDEPDGRTRRPSGSPQNSYSRTPTPPESREDSRYDYLAAGSQSPSPSSYQQQQSLQASHARSMAMTMD